ncbi:MAG: DUF4179 domain-containing protein [Acetatifactor sp.]|nr:DUF4179 domain-containing protein [Acetatifactor sp.]
MKWQNEMPEIPGTVHKAVLDALETINTEKEIIEMKNMSGHKRKRKAFLVAVLAAAMLGTTAFAAELVWNGKAAEQFNNPPEELQQKTLEDGVAAMQYASATDKGITVTAVQTLQDEGRVYVLLKVESEEMVIDGNSLFEGLELTADNPGAYPFNSIGGGFVDQEDQLLMREGYYAVDAMKNPDAAWNGDTLHIALSDFSYYTYGSGGQAGKHIDGQWNLDISLTDASSLSRTIEVDRDFDYDGVAVTINYVKVSPLSVFLSYDRADVDRVSIEEDGTTQLFHFELLDKERRPLMEHVEIGGVSSKYTEDAVEILIGINGVVDMDNLGQILLGKDGTVAVYVE